MKTKQVIEGYACDSCGTFDTYMTGCTGGCGKHFCYDCKDKFTHYNHGVHFCGSGDADFCDECHEKLQGSDIMEAYQGIERLRKESEEWSNQWRKRVDAAESQIKAFTNRT